MSTTFTPFFNLAKFGNGDVGWGVLADANLDIIDANLTNGLPRAYLAGCQTSLTGGSPSTVIAISPGDAQDIGNAGAIRLAATLSKNLNATWAVGSGNGGLAAALSLLGSTTYHLHLIKRTDTGVVDAFFDTAVNAANIPPPYTLFRRIASVLTSGDKLIYPVLQDGDVFTYQSVPTNRTDLLATNPGTNAGTATVLVPVGLNVRALLNVQGTRGTGVDPVVLFSDFDQADLAPSITASPLANFSMDGPSGAITGGSLAIRTNLAAQVRFRLNASAADTILRAQAVGWIDTRGKHG